MADLALEMRVSDDEVLQAMEAAASYRTLSNDTMDWADNRDNRSSPATGERSAGGTPTSDDPGDRVDRRLDLDRVVEGLPPRWQAIVRLRFYKGLTQAEIGEEIGISQVQVSRVLRQALERMRELMDRASASAPPL